MPPVSRRLAWSGSSWLWVFLLLLQACTTPPAKPQAPSTQTPCFIIYDGGSKDTRLYIYQRTTTGWLKHRGPKTAALADPVRGIRGKTIEDADAVVKELVDALDEIRATGPLDKTGKPLWPAFDWQEECHLEAVAVYATAGMRLAEQQHPHTSVEFWVKLNKKLARKVGMPATTRTLTGFEEGLFAWLASRERRQDGNFGIAEMGGASIQVAFPCSGCELSRPVRVKNQLVEIYGESLLGLGQDETWQRWGRLPACAQGVASKNPDWQIADCEAGMLDIEDRTADVSRQIKAAEGLDWYLSDAFRYMLDTDIEEFCHKGAEDAYEPERSCFRAIYLRRLLSVLGLSAAYELSDADWTLGAVICDTTRCLETQ